MPEEDIEQKLDKARLFFERAQDAANADSFDYAIDMYLEGLRCDPDALLEGHIKLRELALLRQAKGGKKPSMLETVKHKRGKTTLEQMLNAEYLFAKDPDHLPYAETILKAATAAGYKKTAKWVADLMFQANNTVEKPSLQTYLLLKNCYEAIGQLDRAVVVCQFAVELKPDDRQLQDEYQRLSTELTVSTGKYDQDGDFRQSIKDRRSQEKRQSQKSIVKTEDYTTLAVEDCRQILARDPDSPQNIFNLAEALSDLQTDQADNEAIELLENTYKTRGDFSFKQRAGQIKIKQLKRKIRNEQAALEADPDNTQTARTAQELSQQLHNFELEHYRLCVKNYPTDLQLKYEYAVRLFLNKQYDEAIPLFQQAQREPRHRIDSMNYIGQCFFSKGWLTDAIDIFNQAISSHEIRDDSTDKQLRYNLARTYEQQGNNKKALEIYRKIAQYDFTYKDVSKRVDKLRGASDTS